MRVTDLFSGIGGFSLGLEAAGMTTTTFCEIDPYCRAVLKKHWPDVPCHDDIRKFEPAANSADLVCGGYPCQGESTAGKRLGEEDERWLWPEMLRIIRCIGTRWVVAENVAGHISLNLDQVISSLEVEGFTVWPFVIPACAVDAPHRRDRVWIIAHNPRNGCRQGGARRSDTSGTRQSEQPLQDLADASWFQQGREKQRPQRERTWPGGEFESFTDSIVAGLEGYARDGAQPAERSAAQRPIGEARLFGAMADTEGFGRRPGLCENEPRRVWGRRFGNGGGENGGWIPESGICRVANGIPNRVDRLKSLGNTVVPYIPRAIGKAIMQYEAENE